MYRYQNNAFRVLGLLPTATMVQITARANEIKVKKSLGVHVVYEYDFPWMGTLDRSEENVIHALQRLENPVSRLKEEMFWFWVCGDADLEALDYLRRNKIQMAHELWSKVRADNLYSNKELDTLLESDPRKAIKIDISVAFNYLDLQPTSTIGEEDIDSLWEYDPRQAVQAEINAAIKSKKEKTTHIIQHVFSDIDQLWKKDPRRAVQAEIAVALSGKYEKIDPSTISAYVNQTLLAHSSVIADEETLDEGVDNIGDSHWKKWNFAIARLFLLSDSRLFWNEIYRKAKKINDPRLNSSKLEEIHNEFITVMLEPNISFISKALNSGTPERAARHSKLLTVFAFPNEILKKGFNRAIAYQIDTINRNCDIAEQELGDVKKAKSNDPIRLRATYSKLLENTKRAIAYCRMVDINGVSDYCIACDKLAQIIRDIATALNNLHIGIHYRKAVEMIEKAIKCASSDFVKEKLEKDNRIIKGNLQNYRNRIVEAAREDESEDDVGPSEEVYRKDTRQYELFDQSNVSSTLSGAAIYRADLQRTGFYTTKGLSSLHGIVWSYKISQDYPEETKGISATPIISDKVIYFGAEDGNLYAVDIQTGEQKWKFNAGAHIYSAPALSGDIVYVSGDNLYAVNKRTGKEIWKKPYTFWGTGGSPAITNGLALLGMAILEKNNKF